MLMHNFRKKYEFPRGPPGRNLGNVSSIFDCFFVVNHQVTGVMHKKGGMYTICSPRSKIVHIYQKTFFANFTSFLQNNEMTRIMMLYIIFVIFAKMFSFCRVGSRLVKFGQNCQKCTKCEKHDMHKCFLYNTHFYKNIIFKN